MGRPSDNLKKQHEKDACNRLLAALRENLLIPDGEFDRAGNHHKCEPDCLWKVDGKQPVARTAKAAVCATGSALRTHCSAHRFLHERADPCLFGGSHLL